jgi:membrane-associated phospholipid phosphatase
LAKPFLPVNTSGQYYTNNVYANFIEVMGVPILDFILSSAMLVVFFNTLRIRNINLRRLCGAITFCFAFCFAFIAFGSDLFHFLSEVIFGKKQKPTSSAKDLEYLLSIVFAACFMFAMVSAFHRVTAATMQLLMKWVYIVFVATFFGYFFIEIIKNQFPRMRFRAIIAFENGSERDLQSYFHQWYELGYNPSNIHILDNNPLFLVSGMRSSADQFKSFPSGHVSYSAVALSLCTLPMIVPKFNT